MGKFVTIKEFKQFHQLSRLIETELVQNILKATEEDIEDQVGYTFIKEDRTDRWISRVKDSVLIPPKPIINSVDTLKLNDVTVKAADFIVSPNKRMIVLEDYYPDFRYNIEVELLYNCGWTECDETDIEDPTLSDMIMRLKHSILILAGLSYAQSHLTLTTSEDKKDAGRFLQKAQLDIAYNTIANLRNEMVYRRWHESV